MNDFLAFVGAFPACDVGSCAYARTHVTRHERHSAAELGRTLTLTLISGLQAQVRSANPSAIVSDWRSIVTYAQNSATVDVPAGGQALLGPFAWQPNAEEAKFDGHRCLLASVQAPGDATPTTVEFDAPNSNNVAQRNLRVTGCAFQLPNPTAGNGTLGLRLTTDAPVEGADTQVELVLPLIQAWYDAWNGTPGISLSVVGTTMRVRLRIRDVTLPNVTLLAGAVLDLSFAIDLGNFSGTRKATIEPTLNGMATSGFSCFGVGSEVPR